MQVQGEVEGVVAVEGEVEVEGVEWGGAWLSSERAPRTDPAHATLPDAMTSGQRCSCVLDLSNRLTRWIPKFDSSCSARTSVTRWGKRSSNRA